MERGQLEEIARRWATEAVAAGNTEVFDELLAEDVRDLSGAEPVVGRASFKVRAATVQAAFSEREVTVQDLLWEGDRIAWRWELRGRHAASLLGVEATGKPVVLRGVNVQRVRDGRVVEHFTMADLFGLLRQLRA